MHQRELVLQNQRTAVSEQQRYKCRSPRFEGAEDKMTRSYSISHEHIIPINVDLMYLNEKWLSLTVQSLLYNNAMFQLTALISQCNAKININTHFRFTH